MQFKSGVYGGIKDWIYTADHRTSCGVPTVFFEKNRKKLELLFPLPENAEPLSMCNNPCFHKPVLLSVSMRFNSKWGTTVWHMLYYITMFDLLQAKSRNCLIFFMQHPFTTWNPSWSCSIPTSENISSFLTKNSRLRQPKIPVWRHRIFVQPGMIGPFRGQQFSVSPVCLYRAQSFNHFSLKMLRIYLGTGPWRAQILCFPVIIEHGPMIQHFFGKSG